MAMFARRVLQRCIDESHTYASDADRHRWVAKLKSTRAPDYIAVEWEIVLLNVFSRFGKLLHEPDLGSPQKADVVLENSALKFCADITAISDKGFHETNPIRELEDQLRGHYQASGITGGGLILNVSSVGFATYKGVKQRRILPEKAEFDKLVFNNSFTSFIDDIKLNPLNRKTHTTTFRDLGGIVQITYIPGQNGAWCQSHPIPQTTIIDSNPLSTALTGKAAQLKNCGYKGPCGIIICDGGTDVLRENFSGMTYSASDVISAFFRKHSSVNFVVTLSLRNHSDRTLKQRIEHRVYVRSIEGWHSALFLFFEEFAKRIPQVTQTPENALNELRFWEGKERRRLHLGGISVTYGRQSAKEIRISTHTLLEALAGRIPQAVLTQHFGMGVGRSNLFDQQLRAGCLLESATVERKPDEDSDEIVFRFGEPDPATSSFVTKRTPPKSEVKS
jgi:hypothetical protein